MTRTCLQGHPGCLYIGDAPHEASPPAPLTEADVRRIVREEALEISHRALNRALRSMATTPRPASTETPSSETNP